MADHATPNLPARNIAATIDFYGKLGFDTGWNDGGWLILTRGSLMLEFFPYPDLDPLSSSFGSCLRLDDLDRFYAVCIDAGIPEQRRGMPRLHPPTVEPSGMRIAYLVDLDGSLLRLVQNPAAV